MRALTIAASLGVFVALLACAGGGGSAELSDPAPAEPSPRPPEPEEKTPTVVASSSVMGQPARLLRYPEGPAPPIDISLYRYDGYAIPKPDPVARAAGDIEILGEQERTSPNGRYHYRILDLPVPMADPAYEIFIKDVEKDVTFDAVTQIDWWTELPDAPGKLLIFRHVQVAAPTGLGKRWRRQLEILDLDTAESVVQPDPGPCGGDALKATPGVFLFGVHPRVAGGYAHACAFGPDGSSLGRVEWEFDTNFGPVIQNLPSEPTTLVLHSAPFCEVTVIDLKRGQMRRQTFQGAPFSMETGPCEAHERVKAQLPTATYGTLGSGIR